MKNIILVFFITATVFMQNTVAQTDSNQSLNSVLTAYIKVKNALTIDNGYTVRVAAKALFNTIDKVVIEKLSSEQRKVWVQYAKDLSYHAEHIKGTDELENSANIL